MSLQECPDREHCRSGFPARQERHRPIVEARRACGRGCRAGKPDLRGELMLPSSGRYVVLEHDHPHRHWDFMLEADGVLRTLGGSPSPPAEGRIVTAERIGDHRLAYLDHDGPVSGGRGTATPWDKGDYVVVGEDKIDLTGRRWSGRVRIEADGRTDVDDELPERTAIVSPNAHKPGHCARRRLPMFGRPDLLEPESSHIGRIRRPRQCPRWRVGLTTADRPVTASAKRGAPVPASPGRGAVRRSPSASNRTTRRRS